MASPGSASSPRLSVGRVPVAELSSCQTQDFIAQFQLVAAFDAAPVTNSEEEPEPAPEPTPEGASEGESTPSTSETEGT